MSAIKAEYDLVLADLRSCKQLNRFNHDLWDLWLARLPEFWVVPRVLRYGDHPMNFAFLLLNSYFLFNRSFIRYLFSINFRVPEMIMEQNHFLDRVFELHNWYRYQAGLALLDHPPGWIPNRSLFSIGYPLDMSIVSFQKNLRVTMMLCRHRHHRHWHLMVTQF